MNNLGITNPAFLANLKRGIQAPTPAEEFHFRYDSGCVPGLVHLDGQDEGKYYRNFGSYRSAWLDWEGDMTGGWTPMLYIDNPVYTSPSTAANTYWHISVWSGSGGNSWNVSGCAPGQWGGACGYVDAGTMDVSSGGLDLTFLDGGPSTFPDCAGGSWVWGPSIYVVLRVFMSCEDPPEPLYLAGHPYGYGPIQGGNHSLLIPVGKSSDPFGGWGFGYGNCGHLQSTAPCGNWVYKIEDCADSSIHYATDTGQGYSWVVGDIVGFWDDNGDDHCGEILSRRDGGDEYPDVGMWDYDAFSDCATCNSNFGI